MLRALPLSEFVQVGGMKEDKKERKHKKRQYKRKLQAHKFLYKATKNSWNIKICDKHCRHRSLVFILFIFPIRTKI